MSLIQTVILSVIQGITELLPVSSTGHMLLFSKIFYHIDPTVLVLTILQFGTTIAILFAFKDLLFKDIFKKEKLVLYTKILIASVPSAIVGLLVADFLENTLYTEKIIAISLFFWGIIMILIENKSVKEITITDINKISYKQALAVGLGQVLAIIPGTSRSGVTTITGIISGIEKSIALQFSFLAGLPLLIGSFFYEIYKYRTQINTVFTYENTIGLIISGVVGLVSIYVLKRFSKNKFLTFFGYYRIILAILLFIFIIK